MENSGLGRRGVSLLISLLFHAGLILLVLHSRYTYKIYPEEVREVIIVPPEKIFIPENMGTYAQTSPDLGLESIKEPLGEKEKFKNEYGREIQKSPGFISNKNVNEITGAITSYPNLTSTFRLELPPKSKIALPENYKLDLSHDFEEKMLGDMKKGYVSKDLDLSEYRYLYSQSLQPTKTIPSSRRFRTGTIRPQGRASFQSKGYDISPWAEGVVDRIQKNWAISPAQEISEKAVVEISVIIEKNGELSSYKIVNSSLEPLLDQAALKALELSSPFPKLPDDFPYRNLEAYFVFQYHD
jgi:TonB family protein